MKTEHQENVGKHAFEVAGLGKAPFYFIGYSRKEYRATPDSPIQPGGTCNYCGQGIIDCCTIKSSDGKIFTVGTTCVNKTGDDGLLKAYKTSKEYRDHQSNLRWEKAQKQREKVRELITVHGEYFKRIPHPYGFSDRVTGIPLTYFDYCEWSLSHCGAKGIGELYRHLLKQGGSHG